MQDLVKIKGEDAESKAKRITKLVEMLDLSGIKNNNEANDLLDGPEISTLLSIYDKEHIKDVYMTQFAKPFLTGKNKEQAVVLIEKKFGTVTPHSLAAYRTFFAIKDEIFALYNRKLGIMVAKQQIEEAAPDKKRAWSGNNDMPATASAPFLALKRVFKGKTADVITELKEKKYRTGAVFKQETIDGRDCIKGTAFNAETIEKSSVKIEFLLKKEPKPAVDLWAIYYGKIMYRGILTGDKSSFEEFKFSSLEKKQSDASIIINNPENIAALKKLGITPKKDASEENKATFYSELFNNIGLILTNNGSTPLKTESVESDIIDYYPVCGLMNPYPPYEAESADFHKNAVSGDFDLFAFWPARVMPDVHLAQLRISEITMKMPYQLKLFMNIKETFGLEFIPSFTEITEGGLKESAELGNISSLGMDVSVKLNTLAANNYTALYKNPVAKKSNRAFHSDEGGRPEVMEVEFPIAIFFPNKIRTKALNNEGTNSVLMSSRPYIDTRGGLIKNIEEFLQLIVDINFSLQSRNELDGYKVMIHSEWMIHFFYASLLPKAEGQQNNPNDHKQFLENGGITVDETYESDEKLKGKLNAFKTITENHFKELSYSKREFDVENYVKNLKIILRGVLQMLETPADHPKILPFDDNIFERLRTRFLELAFEDSKAAVRRASVEDIWPGTRVKPFGAA